MSTKFTLLALVIFCSLNIYGQIDQVSVSSNYSMQAYYKISTGEVTQIANDAWDIAFSSLGQQDGGVFINESAGSGQTPLKLFLAETTDWNSPIQNTAIFTEDKILHNPEENWQEGAFNTVKASPSPFDYGWGIYSPATNSVIGQKIFVIQDRQGSFFKFQITALEGISYSIRYAGLDGSQERTAVLSKRIGDASLIYFSFSTHQEVSMPTDYDLVFCRYTTPLDDGNGNILQYLVTGVLTAPGVEVAVGTGVDPYAAELADYQNQFTILPTSIGHDWKAFGFTTGWSVSEDRVQFIKTVNGEVFKIIFLDFEGAFTGITTLEKFPMGTVSSQEILDISFETFPNPTSDRLYFQSKVDISSITLLNLQGRTLKTWIDIPTNPEINIENIAQGQYFIQFNLVNGRQITKKIIKI